MSTVEAKAVVATAVVGTVGGYGSSLGDVFGAFPASLERVQLCVYSSSMKKSTPLVNKLTPAVTIWYSSD